MEVLKEIESMHGMPIHDEPCKNCPSAWWPEDPESADILTWPKQHMLETAFPCAWRNEKLCKGQADKFAAECHKREVPA